MIVITGATGALNYRTAESLLARMPASELVVVVRDPSKASSFAERGVTVRRGDYADPSTLADAFVGADQLLLVSSNDPHADAVALHRAAIESAVDAGVGRLLYTSHQGAASDTPFGPGRDHWATEQLLAASGVPWTALRNGFYLHSIGWLAGPWRETGQIVVPADGPVSWTSREDAADAAAEILLHGGYDGPVVLTGTGAPSFEDVARIASEVSGTGIRFEALGADAWIQGQIAAGRPEGMVRMTEGMFRAAHEGLFAGTGPLLGELLGRAPRTVRDELDAPAA